MVIVRGYENKRIRLLRSRIRQEAGGGLAISAPEARREVMKDLERILQDSGVIIQPYWQSLYSHTAEKVKGYGVHQTFQMDLQKVWLEAA